MRWKWEPETRWWPKRRALYSRVGEKWEKQLIRVTCRLEMSPWAHLLWQDASTDEFRGPESSIKGWDNGSTKETPTTTDAGRHCDDRKQCNVAGTRSTRHMSGWPGIQEDIKTNFETNDSNGRALRHGSTHSHLCLVTIRDTLQSWYSR